MSLLTLLPWLNWADMFHIFVMDGTEDEEPTKASDIDDARFAVSL